MTERSEGTGGSPIDRLSLADRHADADPSRLLAAVDRSPAVGALVVVTGVHGGTPVTPPTQERP